MRNTMYDKDAHDRLPSTVDEAAELLISDLLVQHLQVLTELNHEDFDLLCEQVTPYLNDEFQIWQGNEALLESCLRQSDRDNEDPARVILDCVIRKLQDINGFLIIT
jgi:hypothetical protein